MPKLTLQVISLDGLPLPYALSGVFSEAGGSIGRDEASTLSLPDKHRRVSRLHATVSFLNGAAILENSSSSLPIAIGEQQVDCGDSLPLADGALIEIGPYLLRAKLVLSQSPSSTTEANSRGLDVPGADVVLTNVQSRLPSSERLPPIAAHEVNLDSLFPPPEAGRKAPSDTFELDQLAGLSGGDSTSNVAPQASNPVRHVARPSAVSPCPQPISAERIGIEDPFADLLSGIGVSSGAANQGDLGQNTQAAAMASPLDGGTGRERGVSADPLAAFGANVSRSAFDSPRASLDDRSRAGGAASARIPDDFNPFAMPTSSQRNAADPLSTLLNDSAAAVNSADTANAAPSIDSLFQDAPAATPAFGSNASSSLLGGMGSFGSVEHGLDRLIASDPLGNDPLVMLDATSTVASAAAHRPMRDDSAEVGAAFRPPTPIKQTAVPPASATSFANISSNVFATPAVQHSGALSVVGASADALTEAFLRGASLAPSALPHGLTPEIMATIGSLLRSATAGAVDMLAARAATKREVQASVTIISVQANNPLKFLPNADAALLQLLGKKMPGFMRADVAMRDAFDDLRAHEVGVIAGTRAALTEVLGKFDPAVLGEKLTKGSVLESLLPSARKAKLWDMYLERYLQIRREAEDDFQSIFGRAFVLAYERETARIKGDSSASGGER